MFGKRMFLIFVTIILLGGGLFYTSRVFNRSLVPEQSVLRFATWAASPLENMVIDRVIDSFTKKTGIYVERETFTHNYTEVMSNQFRQGSAPDVFFVSQVVYPYWQSNGWLANVTDLSASAEAYWPNFEQLFTTDGEFYAVPKDLATLMLYNNQKLLHEAGIQSSDIPTTFDGFLNFLVELQPLLPPGVSAMALDAKYENFMSIFEKLDPIAFSQQQLGNSEPIAQFLTILNHLVTTGVIQMTNEKFGVSASEQFRKQEAVFTIEGNWLDTELKYYSAPFTYRTQLLPTIADSKHTTAFFTGYGVSATTQLEAEAALLVEYLSVDLEKYILGTIRSIPAKKSTTEQLYLPTNTVVWETLTNLGTTSIWGIDFQHAIYAHFFALNVNELIQTPDQIATIFKNIQLNSDEVTQFLLEKAEGESDE